jgi:hypothetical protein
MAVATLSIDLEARLARLEGDLSRATKSIEREAGRMEKAFVGVGGAVKNVVGLLGTGVATTWLINLARQTITGIDALNDLADATGASIENLSALEDIGARTGTTMDTVSAAVIRLNKELAETDKPGSQTAEILRQLGLNAEELKRLDPAEALLRTAQALAQFEDNGNKARIVQALFGKSVAEVGPLLKDLAAAGQLNATVTKEQAEEAEKFNQAISRMQKNFLDLTRSILSDALPALNRFLESAKQGNVLSRFFEGIKKDVGANLLSDELNRAVRDLEIIQARIDFGETGLDRRRNAQREYITGLQRQIAAASQGLKDFANAADPQAADYSNEGRGRPRPSLGAVANPTGTPRPRRAAAAGRADIFGPAVPDAVADAIKRIEGSDETKLQRLRDTLQQLAAIVSSGGAVPDSVFGAITEEITRLDPAAQAAAEASKKLADAVAEGKRIFGDTRTPAEALGAEIERLNELLQLGALDWDTYARAQFVAQDRFDAATSGAGKAAKDLDNTARDLGLTFSSAFEDAIVEGKNLGDVLKSLEKDILRIVTRKLITEPLAGGITDFFKGAGGGGGGGDFFGSLISKAGSLFSGFFAEGGFIPPGRWGIAGERGPEPVFGGRTGATVQPAGGQTIVVNVQAVPGMSRQTAQQQGEQIGRGIRMATMRNG